MTTAGADSYPVSGVARVLVVVSTLILPAGEIRDRYRREHHGELSALPGIHQFRYALGALLTAGSLRLALTQDIDLSATTVRARKPLLCRLNIHHQWRVEHIPGGEANRRCAKCGKDDPGTFVQGTPDLMGGPLGLP